MPSYTLGEEYFQNINWPLLDIKGKSKDRFKSQMDLVNQSMKLKLHQDPLPNGKFNILAANNYLIDSSL